MLNTPAVGFFLQFICQCKNQEIGTTQRGVVTSLKLVLTLSHATFLENAVTAWIDSGPGLFTEKFSKSACWLLCLSLTSARTCGVVKNSSSFDALKAKPSMNPAVSTTRKRFTMGAKNKKTQENQFLYMRIKRSRSSRVVL